MGTIDPSFINPNAVGVPQPVVPVSTEGEGDTQDPLLSTLSQSLAEALLVQLLPAWPVLQHPDNEGANSIDGINAAFGAEFARIGSEMWDGYLDHLEEQKARIADYLNSASFRTFMEDRTMRGQVHAELSTNIDTESPVRNATEFNMYLSSRIQNATDLWSNTIDGVSNFIRENRDDNPAAALFIATSFAITSTYIGDYLNIVDVASTDLVTVNPIQDSVGSILHLVPQQLQEQFTMVVNLFAIGLINFANAEAILKTGTEQQRPPTNWESIVTFAHQVLDKVEGNMVNSYLMAMLINNVEDLGPTQEQRDKTISKLEILAKAMMLSVAVAALLKGSAPDMPINGLIFTSTMTGELKAQSEEDERVVNELSPLIQHFNQLREENLGTLPEEFWDNLMAALGDFFDDNPDVEDLISPTTIYSNIVRELFNNEIAG